MNIILNCIFAFFSTLGFAVLFNIPRRFLVHASICGMLGWAMYLTANDYSGNILIANFLGGFVVGISGEIMARFNKQPATLFVVPGIIPLVPGYGLYYTMSEVLKKDYSSATAVGFETALIAIAIASSIIIATTIGRVLKEWLKA